MALASYNKKEMESATKVITLWRCDDGEIIFLLRRGRKGLPIEMNFQRLPKGRVESKVWLLIEVHLSSD